MGVSISRTTFPANADTEVQVNFDISGSGPCYIGTETSGISFSYDGTGWRNELTLSTGTSTIYVRTRNIQGEISQGIGWAYLDTDHYVEGGWDITVGTVVVPKYESLSFNFAPRQATIQYNGNLINTPLQVGRILSGNVLDHSYSYELERVSEQGAKSVVSGATSATALVHKLVVYRVRYDWHWSQLSWSRPTFRDHLSAIATAIGIPIVYRGQDFTPKTDMNIMLRKNSFDLDIYESITGSFGDILDRLIGWTSDVPNMVINLHISGGTIYLIQRGYETNTLTPSAWALTPTITHTIRRTQWADSQYQTILPKEISSSDAANSNEPYTGTITWNGNSLQYVDGYLISETKGDSTTTYTYTDASDGKLLTRKETTVTDPDTQQVSSTAVTTYNYQTTGEEQYLYEEDYTVTEDSIIITHRLTRHVPIGGGWYGTSVHDLIDGDEEVSSSLSQGAPGQKPTQYCVDSANDALKPASGQGSQRQMVVPLTGVAKARQSYPVADLSTLQAIASALDSYEGREEITLQGEIVGGNHIYTYDDNIVYNGNTYTLVSNNVTVTAEKIRQNITAVRFVSS